MTRGGKRERAGRPKGARNKVTAVVKALAQTYAPAAIEELARLSTGAESEAARVAASKEILDRAYGKPMQPVAATVRDARKIDELSDAELMAIAAGKRFSRQLNGGEA